MMSHDDGVRLANQDSIQLGGEKPEKGENINRIANQLQRKEDSRIKNQDPPIHQNPKTFLQQQQQEKGEDSGRPPDELRMIDTDLRFPQQVLHSNLNFITGGQQIDNFTPHLENQASDNRRLSGEDYPPQERSESPTMHMQIQRHALPQSYSPEHSAEYEDGPKKRKRYEDEASELEDLELFAKDFKQKRIKMGFTQGDVGVAMGKLYGNDFSQTTISRFEALNLSVKNMCKLKPLLQRWLMDVEGALARGERSEGRLIPQPMIPIHTQPIVSGRRRKKRTSIPTDGKNKLEDAFRKNPKPTSEEIYRHSEDLKMEREVVRVWFCNRRQKQKRIQQQYTGEDGSPPSSHDNARSSSPLSEEESYHASQHMSSIIQPPFRNESRMNDRDLMSAVTESSIKAESVSAVIPTMETSALSLVSLAPPTMTSRPNVIRPGLGSMFPTPPPLRAGPPIFATRTLTMSREPTV